MSRQIFLSSVILLHAYIQFQPSARENTQNKGSTGKRAKPQMTGWLFQRIPTQGTGQPESVKKGAMDAGIPFHCQSQTRENYVSAGFVSRQGRKNTSKYSRREKNKITLSHLAQVHDARLEEEFKNCKRRHYYPERKSCPMVVCACLLPFSTQQIFVRTLLGYGENEKGTGHICA